MVHLYGAQLLALTSLLSSRTMYPTPTRQLIWKYHWNLTLNMYKLSLSSSLLKIKNKIPAASPGE